MTASRQGCPRSPPKLREPAPGPPLGFWPQEVRRGAWRLDFPDLRDPALARGRLTPAPHRGRARAVSSCAPLCPVAHELPPPSAQGDSGGPLSCQLNNTWFLMGLSSWSLPCRAPVGPSIFTRLSHFSDWILERQRDTPPPAWSPHGPVSSNAPPSTGAILESGVCRARLLSQAPPLLLLLPLPLLRVP